jgi:hypothetical protein
MARTKLKAITAHVPKWVHGGVPRCRDLRSLTVDAREDGVPVAEFIAGHCESAPRRRRPKYTTATPP